MAKLTKAERKLLAAIYAVVEGLRYDQMKPATRAMAHRLRDAGLIGKRDRSTAKLTQVGYRAEASAALSEANAAPIPPHDLSGVISDPLSSGDSEMQGRLPRGGEFVPDERGRTASGDAS